MIEEDISPCKDQGIVKLILRQGHGDETPLDFDHLSIHYVGKLLDDTQFDSTRDRKQRYEFNLGKDEVIHGWDIGVRTMKRGEIARFICQPTYAFGEQGLGKLVKPNSPVIFEIELIDFKGEDLTDEKDETILKRVLKRSDSGLKPRFGSFVEIALKGIQNDQIFDQRNIKFILGEGVLQDIAEGLEYAISRMYKGEEAHIKLKSKAMIGLEKFNLLKDVEVTYFVTLLDLERGVNKWSMTNAEKLSHCEKLKNRAKELFEKGHYRLARNKYSIILDYLQSDTFDGTKEKSKADELILRTQANLALCYWKSGEYAECIRACGKVLEMDPKNEKCLFRRGQSQMCLFGYQEAIEDFEQVLKLNPDNIAAKQLINENRQQLKIYEQKEKYLYRKIFQKSS